jgi:hypothetical protein
VQPTLMLMLFEKMVEFIFQFRHGETSALNSPYGLA